MRAIAGSLQHGTLVLVGGLNTDPAPLAHPRIRLLGRRDYADMPAYVQAFDACLVPFARTRLTAGVNPIKLREYLAAGRPTVATELPETVPYADGALLPLTAVLTAFGLATIYRLDAQDGGRQAVWVAIGVAVLCGTLIALRHDYRVLESYRYLFGVAAVALLLLPSVPGVGERVNGVRSPDGRRLVAFGSKDACTGSNVVTNISTWL